MISLNTLIAGCGVEGTRGFSTQQEDSNTATLSWEAPATNVDGTELTDLAGYKIYYGTISGDYTITKDVGLTDTPNTPEYALKGLESGTVYLTVTAYDTSGNESDYSEEVYKDIP